MPGCATKKDVRTLTMMIEDMQVQQDSVLRTMQMQNGRLLDTLRSSVAVTLDSRGQTSFQLEQLNKVLESTRLLVGQNLEAMRVLAARMDAVEGRLQQAQQAPPQTVASANGSAEQLYQQGLAKLNEGSYGSARALFQSVIANHRNDPRAADAQFQIGETWVLEESYDDAYDAFERVASDWPSSPRAGEALYRAGKVAQDRKDNDTARRFYGKVVQLYGSSDYAELAKAALRKIPR
jgi:tol-pal system protein YbgF